MKKKQQQQIKKQEVGPWTWKVPVSGWLLQISSFQWGNPPSETGNSI